MLTGFLYFLIFIFAFSTQRGNIYMFRNFKLLKLLQSKLLKMLVLFLQLLLRYRSFVMRYLYLALKSFSICFWSNSIKLKLSLSVHLPWLAIMLWWFLCFRIAFKVASLVLPKVCRSVSWNIKILHYIGKKVI